MQRSHNASASSSKGQAAASRSAHKGINFAGVQLAETGGNEGAKGMGHDTGSWPVVLDQDACQGMCHFINVHAARMQPHGHVWHVQQDHRPAAVLLLRELADEAPIGYLSCHHSP